MDERRQRSLHVGRPAAVQTARRAARRPGRPTRPRIGDADRVHVRVEQHARTRAGIERPDHVAELVDLDRVTEPLHLGAHAHSDVALAPRRARRPHEVEGELFQGGAVQLHGEASCLAAYTRGYARTVTEAKHVYWRRRLIALAGVAAVLAAAALLLGNGESDGERSRPRPTSRSRRPRPAAAAASACFPSTG